MVSNDTDTFAHLLYYIPWFQSLGLEELWQQYGTVDKRRILPLHNAISRLGVLLAKSIIKAHILTGNDSMSKIGTKHAAIVSDPVTFLERFGETDKLSEEDEAKAEKYLVQVWTGVRSTTHALTFNQLRVEKYCSATAGLDSLPPTSSVIKGHIHRGAYLAYNACHLLETADCQNSESLEQEEYGWEKRFRTLLPSKCMKPLKPEIIIICKCVGNCNTQRCGCKSA